MSQSTVKVSRAVQPSPNWQLHVSSIVISTPIYNTQMSPAVWVCGQAPTATCLSREQLHVTNVRFLQRSLQKTCGGSSRQSWVHAKFLLSYILLVLFVSWTMSTSSRTNLAVLIYEQTFTNCVCFCYRKNTKKLQQPRHGTSDAVIKHDVQEWFQFGVNEVWRWSSKTVAAWPLHRRRRNQTQTITCFNFGHRYNADNGMERLVLKMAVPLSCQLAH